MEFVERVISRVNGLPEKSSCRGRCVLPKIQGVLLEQLKVFAEYVYALQCVGPTEAVSPKALSTIFPKFENYNRRLAGYRPNRVWREPLPSMDTVISAWKTNRC